MALVERRKTGLLLMRPELYTAETYRERGERRVRLENEHLNPFAADRQLEDVRRQIARNRNPRSFQSPPRRAKKAPTSLLFAEASEMPAMAPYVEQIEAAAHRRGPLDVDTGTHRPWAVPMPFPTVAGLLSNDRVAKQRQASLLLLHRRKGGSLSSSSRASSLDDAALTTTTKQMKPPRVGLRVGELRELLASSSDHRRTTRPVSHHQRARRPRSVTTTNTTPTYQDYSEDPAVLDEDPQTEPPPWSFLSAEAAARSRYLEKTRLRPAIVGLKRDTNNNTQQPFLFRTSSVASSMMIRGGVEDDESSPRPSSRRIMLSSTWE